MKEEKEKIVNQNEEKIKELPHSTNKENLNNISNNPKLYTNCLQSNFTIISNNKSFNLPLLIEQVSLSLIQKNIIHIKDKKAKGNIKPINNTSIFIGGRQNLKGMRIHLSNNYKYNNTVHREITNFKNLKNKSVDKTNARLTENKSTETISIDLNENKKLDISEAINMILTRWKNNQKIKENNLSFITKQESFLLNKKNYINGLINKININSNTIKEEEKEKKNNFQEKYILIKQNNNSKENNFIYDILTPNTNEEVENSINSFIFRSNDNKENLNNNSVETLMSTQDNNYLNNGKKKSKFNNKNNQIKSGMQEIINLNSAKNQKEEFSPIFILTSKDIKELYEIVFKDINENKEKKINYTIGSKINVNFINKRNEEKLKGKVENKRYRNLDEINFEIFPVKGDKFEFINIVPNEVRANYNIDVSNIQLNQSDYINKVKGGENDFEYLLNKNKEMEDFSQNTPISLLQEKYFIYAVSKWIKFSMPNPQSQLYVKYSYKTGHPMFDPINLIMTNFTLWIERIETKRNDNKKAIVSISSSINFNNSKKIDKNNVRGKSSSKKKGYAKIYSNQSINYINNDNNQINKNMNNNHLNIHRIHQAPHG